MIALFHIYFVYATLKGNLSEIKYERNHQKHLSESEYKSNKAVGMKTSGRKRGQRQLKDKV